MGTALSAAPRLIAGTVGGGLCWLGYIESPPLTRRQIVARLGIRSPSLFIGADRAGKYLDSESLWSIMRDAGPRKLVNGLSTNT